MSPLIIDRRYLTQAMIRQGAARIVYATSTTLGCAPDMLTMLSSNDNTAYDELGCLKAVNNLIQSYNTALRTAFTTLRVTYPNVTILSVDFYNATRSYIVEKSARGKSYTFYFLYNNDSISIIISSKSSNSFQRS